MKRRAFPLIIGIVLFSLGLLVGHNNFRQQVAFWEQVGMAMVPEPGLTEKLLLSSGLFLIVVGGSWLIAGAMDRKHKQSNSN